MQRKGNGLAIALIVIGAIMLMGILPHLIHGIFGILFPVLLVVLGYYGIKSGRKIIGWVVLFIGVMALISKLAWIIGPLLGIALVVWGISVLRGKRNRTY
jgi:predicted membrane protein